MKPQFPQCSLNWARLQSALREDAQRLPECIRLVNKTTGQYIAELDYEASAVAEELEAKIRAQEELVNPKIAQLNKTYKGKIKGLSDNFDQELESLQKLKAKTEKSIEAFEEKIKLYQREAKSQSKKGHEIYEKRWKEKIKQTQKDLNGLKKELKNIENHAKKVSKQKTGEIAKLYAGLDAEVKFARQPLVELEAAREAKTRGFKLETEKLLALEKPVVEGLNQSLRLRESVNANFEALSIKEQQLKSPALFYVPFYLACYEVGLSRRYLILPPSTINTVDFSAKLKGAFGMSKTKDLLTPRFRALTALIDRVQELTKQNSAFESQLASLGEKSNVLRNSLFLEKAAKGLVYLEHEGWFSQREHQVLSNQLKV